MSTNTAIATSAAGNASGESAQSELCNFAATMFEKCGGAVEWSRPSEDGVAVLPEPVAKLFGVEETVPLATHQERGALCISLASDFLDLAQVVLDSFVARVGAFRIPEHYLKKGDHQALVDDAFTWHNARVRFQTSERREIDYHAWWFFASLKSEDVWESRINVTLNAASKAPIEMPDLLSLVELEPMRGQYTVTPEQTFDNAVHLCQTQMLEQADGFIARMEARLERDRKRLRDYYGALRKEAGSTKRRTATPPSEEEVSSRKRAVNLELERKLAELGERYQMEASLEPIAMVCLRTCVLAIDLQVQRKRAERTIQVYWNPITKHIEPLCCHQCGKGTFSLAFTDDEVDPLCATCHSGKPAGGRTGSH